MTTIGFIGLGNMGLPMCQRLAVGNAEVVAFDLRAEAVDAAVAASMKSFPTMNSA
ncbi:MAG: NAD(P)-binding domain-containing protein, partial [Ilumatobacteraceae bacterium]